jgi:hypothetical protein
MPDPSVQVVIVAWNSGAHLQRCLDALAAQTFTDFEAVVWDNASTDGAVDRPACRRGPASSARRRTWDSPPPTTAPPRWAEPLDRGAEPRRLSRSGLAGAAGRHGRAARAEAAASLQLDDADPSRLDGAGDSMSIFGIGWRGGYGAPRSAAPEEEVEVFSPCGAAALYRRDVWEALGGFEERFFAYFEDVDLGFRIRPARRPHRVQPPRGGPPCGIGLQPDGLGLRRAPRHAQPAVDLPARHAGPAHAPGPAAARGGHGLRAGA